MAGGGGEGRDAEAGTRADVAIHLGVVPVVLAGIGPKPAESGAAPALAACCELIAILCAPPAAGTRQLKLAEGGSVEALVAVLRERPSLDAAKSALGRVVASQPQLRERALQAGAEPQWLGDVP